MNSVQKLLNLLPKVKNNEAPPSAAGLNDRTNIYYALPKLVKLRADHFTMSHMAAAANKLGMYSMEIICKTALAYITHIATTLHGEHLTPIAVPL